MIYYALYDKSMKVFFPPFVSSGDAAAKIAVRDFLLTSEAELLQKLQDNVSLARLAVFDRSEGVFNMDLEFICNISDIPVPELRSCAVRSDCVSQTLENTTLGGDGSEKIS